MSAGVVALYQVLCMCTDLAGDVAGLNENLKANRKVIDLLQVERPDLWENLRRRTQARRLGLQQAGKHGQTGT